MYEDLIRKRLLAIDRASPDKLSNVIQSMSVALTINKGAQKTFNDSMQALTEEYDKSISDRTELIEKCYIDKHSKEIVLRDYRHSCYDKFRRDLIVRTITILKTYRLLPNSV